MDKDNNSNSQRPKKDQPSADELLKKLRAKMDSLSDAQKEQKPQTPQKSEEINIETQKPIKKIDAEDLKKMVNSYSNESNSTEKFSAEKAPTKEIPKVQNVFSAKPTTDDDDIDIDALMRKYVPEAYASESEKSEKNEPEPEIKQSAASIIFTEPTPPDDVPPIDRYEGFTPKKKVSAENDSDLQKRIKAAEAYATALPEEEEKPTDIINAELEETIAAEKKREIDDVDVNLMIAFGMDDELEKTVGIEKVNEIESNIEKTVSHISDKTIQTGEDLKLDFEYTSQSQVKEIIAGYKKKYQYTLLLRIPSCFLLLIIAFLYENIGFFGGSLPTPFQYPIVYVLINLQFLIFGAALIYKSLYNGMKSLFKFKPTPDSITFVVLFLTVIYHVVICVMNIYINVKIFNFAVLMFIFLNIIYEFMNLKRELYGFNIASSKRIKYVIDRINPNKTELESETFYEYLPANPLMLKIKKTSFVDGFYRRMNSYPNNKKILNAIIPIMLIISAAFFAFAYIRYNDIYYSMLFAYMALIVCTPFSLFITYSYPFYKASKDAYGADSAIVGESSLEEYSKASAISFDDKDVFPSYGVKVKSVKTYDNNRIDQVIYYAASLFRHIGGPLADVFDIATLELGHEDKVDLIQVADDGIEAMVGEIHVLVGKASYLRLNGFKPENPGEDEKIEDGGEVGVMYMVCGGEVAAKMYIQYVIDPDFEFILKQLYKAGMCVGIKTFDPNINDRMLSARVRLSKYPVKIIRCRGLEDQIETEARIESGIISKGSTKSLLQTFAMCDKVLQITRTNLVVKMFAMIISVIIMVFIMSLGLDDQVNSFYVALYQLFWSIPMVIIARLFI